MKAARVTTAPSTDTDPASIRAWACVRERASPRPTSVRSSRTALLLVAKTSAQCALNLVEELRLLLEIIRKFGVGDGLPRLVDIAHVRRLPRSAAGSQPAKRGQNRLPPKRRSTPPERDRC